MVIFKQKWNLCVILPSLPFLFLPLVSPLDASQTVFLSSYTFFLIMKRSRLVWCVLRLQTCLMCLNTTCWWSYCAITSISLLQSMFAWQIFSLPVCSSCSFGTIGTVLHSFNINKWNSSKNIWQSLLGLWRPYKKCQLYLFLCLNSKVRTVRWDFACATVFLHIYVNTCIWSVPRYSGSCTLTSGVWSCHIT